jgi:ankyrin repeat protein
MGEGVVELLLAHPGIQVSSDSNDALVDAARCGNAEAVKLLLAHAGMQGDQARSRRLSAFLAAVQANKSNVVRLMLDSAVFDISARDSEDMVMSAATGGHEAMLRMLLDSPRIDVSSFMQTPHANRDQVVATLLRKYNPRNRLSVVTPPEASQLSLQNGTDEDHSNSGSDEEYYDAEEGKLEEDKTLDPSILG